MTRHPQQVQAEQAIDALLEQLRGPDWLVSAYGNGTYKDRSVDHANPSQPAKSDDPLARLGRSRVTAPAATPDAADKSH